MNEENAEKIIFPLDASASPKAIIIHCSDPRFQRAFQMFIEGSKENGCLGYAPGEYAAIVIPGSIASLSEMQALPKHFKITKEQIELLMEKFHTIETLVLINHEDCSGYKEIQKKVNGLSHFVTEILSQAEISDLTKVAKTLLSLNTVKSKIRLFFAKKENGTVVFEEHSAPLK